MKIFLKGNIKFSFERTMQKPLEVQQNLDRESIDNFHRALADDINHYSLEKYRDLILAVGIVKFQNEKFEFIHFTFREYFVALNFMSRIIGEQIPYLEKPIPDSPMKEILIKPDFKLIRLFMDKHLERMNATFEKITEKNIDKFW